MNASELQPGQRIRVGKAEWTVRKVSDVGLVYFADAVNLFSVEDLDAIGFDLLPDPAPDGTVWQQGSTIVAVMGGFCHWVSNSRIEAPTLAAGLTAPDSGWSQVGGAR